MRIVLESLYYKDGVIHREARSIQYVPLDDFKGTPKIVTNPDDLSQEGTVYVWLTSQPENEKEEQLAIQKGIIKTTHEQL